MKFAGDHGCLHFADKSLEIPAQEMECAEALRTLTAENASNRPEGGLKGLGSVWRIEELAVVFLVVIPAGNLLLVRTPVIIRGSREE